MISIDEMVGGADWRMTQTFGKTAFSTTAGAMWYTYATSFCLEAGTHPGLDIGVALKTPLYSPVAGTVIVAGGVSAFSRQNLGTTSHTGQLKIEMDNGNHVILGHMRKIEVDVGDRVEERQYVGLSGRQNGAHVHLELRVPDAACLAGFRIVNPIDKIVSEHGSPQVEPIRLFRVDVETLPVYEEPSTSETTPGSYLHGEIVACHRHVILAQRVEPGERAWGNISGGPYAGKWAFLGFTTEVRSVQGGVEYFAVTTNVKNIRLTPDSQQPPVGTYTRGSVLPIGEVKDGEEVDPGQRAWGKIASGPHIGKWAYLGSNSTLKLT